MKALVFGKTGQVATCLQELAGPDLTITALGREEADLTRPSDCAARIEQADAQVVINAAAYTAVDKAETETDAAELINHHAVGAMAAAAAARQLPFLHISTDYVFPGHGTTPWHPTDPTGPLGFYGATKLRGEEATIAAGGRHAILRTSWVYSEHGNNFVKTMLRLGKERDALSIVDDQIGGPTSAMDIAKALIVMARRMQGAPDMSGVWHLSGAPDCSWADFATEIFAQSGLQVQITRIPTEDFPTPATRPLNSRLDCRTLFEDFGIAQANWRDSLRDVLVALGDLK